VGTGFPKRSRSEKKKKKPSMIRKVGTGFPKRSCSEKDPEHDPQKWKPTFQKDHAQTIRQSAMTIRPEVIAL
jgi:hypothetical protein